MKLNEEKVRICMARKCFTVSRLASVYGVSRSRISYILNQKQVTQVVAGRLAAALGVDVTEILED